MKKKLYLLLLSFVCVITVFAQADRNGQFTIKGQVMDSLLNETVPYATLNIVLAEQPGVSVKRLACDIDGRFETTLNSPGNYIISMQSVGKIPSEKNFILNENKKNVDLGKLYMAEDQQRLEEVTVVAQKPLVKVEIDKLTYSMEDDPESETNNTLDMLRKVPMVTVDAEDKIQLKGSGSYKIYLNGKPSNMLSGDNASDVLKSMPASSVKNIEVITDPGAKYDADGVGGIINIITSKNALQGYTATVRTGISTLGRYNAGGNFSTKVGKFGVTANYNYNNFRNPWSDMDLIRETETGQETFLFTQDGRNKRKNGHQFGSLEASYEIDSLNLISLGLNIWQGNYNSNSELISKERFGQTLLSEYNQYTHNKGKYGSIDMNLDFQHSTRKPDELLTLSYRFSHSPNDSKGYTVVDTIQGLGYEQRNINDAYTNEHTAQVDYTTPLPHNQVLEAGAKYIMRESNSDADVSRLWRDANCWVPDVRPDNHFSHMQHIYGAYLGYSVKWKKYAFKTGVRAEGTALRVEYKNARDRDFKNDFFNVVPNATVSYQINMSQTVRLGYNMRIYRPGIWHLNPYENDTDPQNVSKGNPGLDPEKSHSLNLNYSMFTMKFNLNLGINYSYLNNSILRYSFIDYDHPDYPGRMVATFDNLGKEHRGGFYLYTRWAPKPLFSVYINGGMNLVNIDVDSSNENVTTGSVKGVNGYLYPGMEINLPKDFRINLNGGFSTPWIQYQTKSSTHHYHAVSVNKSFMEKKLNVSLSCSNPFLKEMKFHYTVEGDNFYSRTNNSFRARDVRLNVSYRFGTLKDSIKKVRRGITNDDTKGNEAGGGGGQQGM